MHNLTNRNLPYFLVCSLILFIVSCKKLDLNKISQSGEWNPKLAIPLAHAEFGVYDILARTDSTDLVVINPASGEIALIYRGDLFSYEAKHFVTLSDFNYAKNASLVDLGGVPSANFSGSITQDFNEVINVPSNSGVEINSMQFFAGNMIFKINSSFKHDIAVTLTFPNLTSNGVVVTRTLDIPYTGSVPNENQVAINLANVQGTFTGTGTEFNKLNVQTKVVITGTGNEIVGNENVQTSCVFSGLEFENIYGYFGQQDLGLASDSITLKLFQTLTDGHFELVNPKIKFTLTNSFGFPVKLTFDEIKTININTGAEFALSNFQQNYDVQFPSVLGGSALTEILFNTSNTTNLSQLISPVPKYFFFDVTASANPLGKTSLQNFISRTSKINVHAEVEMPVEGLAYGFALRDTVNFSFNENTDNIENIMFRLIANNGFPIDVMASLVFIDQNGLPLFTIFQTKETFVSAAPVDGNGRVTQRNKKITDISLTKEQINLLKKADKIIINAEGQTLQAQSNKIVKFYDDYGLNVKVAMQMQAKYQF